MRNSQRLMQAIGELDGELVTQAGRALGYTEGERRSARVPVRLRRALLIAAVTALLLTAGITAYAARLWGIREMYRSASAALPESASELIETRGEQAAGDGWSAEITESLCDAGNVLITVAIHGGERYLLAPTDASPNDPLWQIGREGEASIGEYAAAQGKEPLFVGARLAYDDALGISQQGQRFEFPAENEMVILIVASKTVSAPRLDTSCVVYALRAGSEETERLEIPLVLTESGARETGVFAPLEPEAVPGLRMGELTVTETPLGCTLQWEVVASDQDALYGVQRVAFDEISDYVGGGATLLEGERWLEQLTMAHGDVGDTLTARFYDWDGQEIGTVIFCRKQEA